MAEQQERVLRADFDAFNRDYDVPGLLRRKGWQAAKKQRGGRDRIDFVRPGKDEKDGISANWHTGQRVLFVFTTGSEFSNSRLGKKHDAGTAYNAAQVFCVLECNGDMRAAIDAIKDLGYTAEPQPTPRPQPVKPRQRAAATPTPPAACEPPSAQWQARAWDFIATSQDALWGGAGLKALAWLAGRGLSEDTIMRGGLGYHAGNPEYEERPAWGLPDELNDKGNLKKVWLPRGVVIPWVIGNDIWRVNIRRPVGDPKYIGPTGWGNALYDADQLTTDRPAILVEGEFDALSIKQAAGDLVTPCATGSTEGSRRARWLARLALCPRVLVAFDADKAGEDARQYWLGVLPNGRYWRPFWGDANGMQTGGGDLRGWVEAGLNGA